MSRVVRLPPRARTSEVGSGKRIAVLGLDLGGVSGLAWWSGELKGSIDETLKAGAFGFDQIDCGRGNALGERTGAEAICQRYVSLAAEWTLDAVPVPAQSLAIEDFILRGKIGSTARAGLSSPRMAGLVEGMLVRMVSADNIARYAPARSKSFATSDRLKKWGLWCRSMPHARDAAKQVAIHIASLLDAR